MAYPSASSAIWNWLIDAPVPSRDIRVALAAVLGRPVAVFGAGNPAELPGGTVLCDVWIGGGDFPVRVDCYAVPVEPAESAVAAAFARRLGRDCLLPDDTLDPGRHLLARPDTTIRPVHMKITEGEDGDDYSELRMCTPTDPWCRDWARYGPSRWAPGAVITARAAA
ncbi:hypothetical protein [Polymorphospora rubra]|uniref:Uncharacterized protein n=1 Tax=Polymorphospora rubra TaxID=338584 RepID=A0A810N4J7_9ACTN|nr:hypothetical protein [Polymorphospora rubra]BCJ67119.1 hypothetical protein Prubr_41400 [Polymorphospora rubra]